jgi:hypothetical protein
MTSMPTFTIPPCSVAIVDTTGPIAVEREVVADPVITPAPTFTDPLASNASNDTTSCRDLWVCADAIAVCGEVTSRIKRYVAFPSSSFLIPLFFPSPRHPQPTFSSISTNVLCASCYNTCTDDGVLSTPPCTIPPKTTATITSEEGPRSTLDICEEQAWMCAPDWW